MSEETYNLVRSRYGTIARLSSRALEGRPGAEENIAKAFGYTVEDLGSLPERTNLGLSCGNPLAFANIKEGETIVDLGSGGGIDVILAARKTGNKGNAVGIDMTKEMIDLATKNAEKAGVSNALFVEASITAIPLPDSSVDCVISNCVLNLVPAEEKRSAFREIHRLLRPGGRVAISDILAKKPLPETITKNMTLYAGCIAGASQVMEYEEHLRGVGFREVMMVDTKSDLNLYRESSSTYLNQSSCCGPGCGGTPLDENTRTLDFNEWAGSFQIYAIKRG